MTHQISRQVALMTVGFTCVVMVALVLALGLGADPGAAFWQIAPLALICGIALTMLVADPIRPRS